MTKNFGTRSHFVESAKVSTKVRDALDSPYKITDAYRTPAQLARDAKIHRNRVTAGVVAAVSLLGVGLGVERAMSQEQTHCVTTDGASTIWDNGVAAVNELRNDGARHVEIHMVVDPLVELPNNEGVRAGIEVCASQRTGIGAVILPTSIEVTP